MSIKLKLNTMKKNKGLLILILLFAFSFSLNAQYEKLQTAFIYNFTKYMEWPSNYRSGDFVVGVINNQEMVTTLNAMVSGKKVGDQTIVVKTFGSVNDASDCHLIFLPESLAGDLDALKNKLTGSTLIVGNSSGLAKKGADINFVVVGGKLSFEMNKSSISTKNIKVNSRLEQLAYKVY